MRKIAIGLLVIFCCVAVKCTVGQTLRFTQIEKTSPVGAGSVVVTNTAGVLTYTTKLPSSVIPTLSAYVPYTGATNSVNLGANNFSTSVISFSTNGIAKQNSTTATSTNNGSWWLNSEATNGWQWYLNDATNIGYHTQWKNATTGFGVYLANAGGTKAQIGTTSNEALGLFVNGGAPKIRIATSGNVGINSTIDPLSTFSVSGDVGISSTATITGNSQLTGSVNIGSGTYGTDNLHQLRVTKGTGTVDIGQFTAGYGTIWAGVNTPAATNYAMASNGTNLVLNAPVSNIFMSVANGANLVNVNANTNYFTKPTRIGSSTAPSATLDVTGTMSVSSTATINGVNCGTGNLIGNGTNFTIDNSVFGNLVLKCTSGSFVNLNGGSTTALSASNSSVTIFQNLFSNANNNFGQVSNSSVHSFYTGSATTASITFQGWVGTTIYPAIYMGGITPSSTNYAVLGLGSTTALNSTSSTYLRVSGTDKLKVTSTDNMFSGSTAFNDAATTTAASAKVEIVSTTKGFLPPRMTTTQKNAISSPAEGLVVYDTTLHKLCIFTGTVWETVTSL